MTVDQGDVALRVDKDSRFANTNDLGRQWLDHEDPQLMVWMQVELFPSFKKLYGTVGSTLKKGETYTLTVSNLWYYPSFETTRSVVITESNGLGENPSLGWIFLAASIVLFILSI